MPSYIEQVQQLGPRQAATIADTVYAIKELPSGRSFKSYFYSHNPNLSIGCEDEFDIRDEPGFYGKSGGYIFRKLTGFGYACKGSGMRTGQILVATRGTDTMYDLITDVQAAPAPWKGGSFVHNGFKRVFDSYVDQLDDFMGRQCVSHVHCVGHSLGGALATLNAAHIAHKYGVEVSLYTFGSPRVGHMGFAQQLTRSISHAAL